MEIWDVLDGNRNKTGKVIQRGQPMKPDEYHLVVFAVLINNRGEILISKRTPNKTFPNKWEIPGGAAVRGDDSYQAILREVKEEVGVDLTHVTGRILKSTRCDTGLSYFADVWLFELEIDIDAVVCQPEEVSEVKLVPKSDLVKLMQTNAFVRSELILSCIELL